MKKISIIGAGFSSLAAACTLAEAGFDVSVYEKNNMPGGRAQKFEAEGFVFDMGPSWYWMPEVFENFFARFGKKLSDYYKLDRLDPGYQVIFPQDKLVKIPANQEALYQLFEDKESGSGAKLKKFLAEAEYKYKVGMNEFVWKPSQSIMEFADPRVVKSAMRLKMFSSISKQIRALFKHPQLISILEFPVLFLGATPQKTPALYSLMNYADLVLGTWYPQGGMHEVPKAMHALAVELGVKFHFGSKVIGFDIQRKLINKIKLADKTVDTDLVVAGADYHHVDQMLLPKDKSNYSAAYWDKRAMAPSSLLFYLGVDKKLDKLKHHNLFFDEDFGQHAHEIYTDAQWPSKPLFYVCCPSKTDPSVAPEGKENVFILIPIAVDLKDEDALHEKYLNIVMERLERFVEGDVKSHIIYKRVFSVRDFKSEYNSFKGNAYGLANTLKQTAVLKPGIKNKKLDNLYYTGQLTTPGPGVPPSIISGQVVAEEIIKSYI